MSAQDLLLQTRKGYLNRFDALHYGLNLCDSKPEKIEMLIQEIDLYIFEERELLEFDVHGFINKYFSNVQKIDDLTIEQIESKKYKSANDNTTLLEAKVFKICESKGYKNYNDIPHETKINPLKKDEVYAVYKLESVFFPFEFYSFYELKKDLLKYCEPQQPEPHPAPKKKQSKDVWGFKARYNFLDDLGVLKPLEKSGISKKNLQIVVSQILGCNVYTARDLINGDYNTIETKDELLERKQLIDLIKYKPTE